MEITTNQIIVAFRIGRGGRFYNAGFKSYIGEKKIGEFTNDLFPQDDGRYLDGAGNDTELTQSMVDLGIGHIDEDGHYDYTYTCYLSDCDESEFELIRESDQYKSTDLETALNETK